MTKFNKSLTRQCPAELGCFCTSIKYIYKFETRTYFIIFIIALFSVLSETSLAELLPSSSQVGYAVYNA